MSNTHKPLVLSGMQPTNTLHLGNYLGALKNWVRMQEEMPCLFCVVDMHAITAETGYGKPEDLVRATREVTAAYIAGGVDVKRTPIFNQGQVPEHAELSWVFNCVARLGWMDRMTQFKEKSGKHKERASVGLYTYPVLMAADILVYKATHVPVGEDQKQHLELARDIAGAFNRRYGVEFFPLPEPQIFGAGTRVMSLRDGTKKMSKSDASDYSRINLTDDSDTIALKIKKAKTDPAPLPGNEAESRKRPEADNLLGIYAALSGLTRQEAVEKFAGRQFSAFKNELAEVAADVLGKIGAEMRRLLADPGYIDGVLKRGAARADAIAAPVLRQVFDIMGLLRP
jgi:tryptophanyl-tRNA synthetase